MVFAILLPTLAVTRFSCPFRYHVNDDTIHLFTSLLENNQLEDIADKVTPLAIVLLKIVLLK